VSRRARPPIFVATLVLGALVVATSPAAFAAGNGTATDSTAAPSPSAATTAPATVSSVRGVTDTTITIGGVGQLARYATADVGAKARFQRANAEGGVNGRTFNYVGMRDDSGIGATNAQVASTLVQQDKVFALVPVITPDVGAVPDLLSGHVPYFGWAVSSNFCGNQWGFSFTGCMFPPGGATTSNAWGVLVAQTFGEKAAGKTAAIVTENTDSGKYFVATVTAGAKDAGLKVVSGASPLPVPAVADYDAIAKELLAADNGAAPDAIFVVAGYPNVAQLRQAVRAAGYRGVFTDTVEYEPTLVGAATGSLVFTPTAAVESASTNPAMAQLVADVKAVAPGQPIDQSVIAGYWSADLLIAAVTRAGRNLTPESLVKKANSKFTYKVPGTVGPVRFPEGHREPAPCGSLVQSTGSAFVVAAPYACGQVIPTGT
jgi:ABC-type branched-subunit amino acid transport system substrate-binding protein